MASVGHIDVRPSPSLDYVKFPLRSWLAIKMVSREILICTNAYGFVRLYLDYEAYFAAAEGGV